MSTSFNARILSDADSCRPFVRCEWGVGRVKVGGQEDGREGELCLVYKMKKNILNIFLKYNVITDVNIKPLIN